MPCRQSLSVEFIEKKEMGREERMGESDRRGRRERQRQRERGRDLFAWGEERKDRNLKGSLKGTFAPVYSQGLPCPAG